MDGLQHLQDRAAFVINLDGAHERMSIFTEENEPIVRVLHRVPAYEGTVGDAELHRLNTAATLAKMGYGGRKFIATGQAKQATLARRPDLQRLYAATYGCYRSHVLALTMGLDAGYDRFVIFEDDAHPRLDVLRAVTAPPESAEIIAWGGAYPMGAWRTDVVNWLGGRKPSWYKIVNPFRKYKTTAYEVTRHGAERLWTSLRRYPAQVDVSWWPAMLEVPTVRLDPMGFAGDDGADGSARSAARFARRNGLGRHQRA